MKDNNNSILLEPSTKNLFEYIFRNYKKYSIPKAVSKKNARYINHIDWYRTSLLVVRFYRQVRSQIQQSLNNLPSHEIQIIGNQSEHTSSMYNAYNRTYTYLGFSALIHKTFTLINTFTLNINKKETQIITSIVNYNIHNILYNYYIGWNIYL